MKLSAAIREGAKLRPQAFRDMFVKFEDDTVGSCAYGAAYEVLIGHDFNGASVNELRLYFAHSLDEENRFDIYSKEVCECVQGCPYYGSTYDYDFVVTHLNDVHMWSREKIADWLEARGK